MISFDKVKIRCSCIGDIMTPPKEKAAKERGELSATCKTYLRELYAEVRYGRSREIISKYTEKGKMVQTDSLDLVSRLDKKMYYENDIRVENEFLTGEIDASDAKHPLQAKMIAEIKSCWDYNTFLIRVGTKLEAEKEAQMQGYMAITGARAGHVNHCLVNAPESIIADEERSLFYKMNTAGKVLSMESPDFVEACEKLRLNLTFDDIPEAERRVKHVVEYSPAFIEQVYEKVIQCRKWLQEFHEEVMSLNN